MKYCTFSAGSITRAYKARAQLEDMGIKCEIVRLDPSMTKNGCAYGISLDCSHSRSAQRVLGGNTEQIK